MDADRPHEDHGKTEYLTIEDLERSTAVDSYSLDEAVKNLVATVDVATGAAGHHHSVAGPPLSPLPHNHPLPTLLPPTHNPHPPSPSVSAFPSSPRNVTSGR